MARLEDPVAIGSTTVRNRLYRAPLLEVAANKPDAARILERELAPAAESGAGLVFQGASLVTAEGGRTAPGLSRFHDRAFVLGLAPAVAAVKQHGARLFVQLGHGALQSMEAWHAAYRAAHPGLATHAVSRPPWWFRAMLRARFLRIDNLRVFTTEELHALARAFGEAARHARDAGYDGIHLAGANGSIFQELWSPVFNERSDEFGGKTVEDRSAFLRLVVREIRRATRPDFPVTAKIPAETVAPWFVRGALTLRDGVAIARACREAGVDAVAPVTVGVTRDQSVARGRFPKRAWDDPRFAEGYARAFGSPRKARVVRLANRLAARLIPFEPVWNEAFFSAVKREVDGLVVLAEGGIRTRAEMDRLLRDGRADMVGMARPFYAEPHAAARLLNEPGAAALCESCNNCTVPQVAGLPGVCRTPEILARRGDLAKRGAYSARKDPVHHEIDE
ncbi:MAG TPA: NADH:flavin oxidoreductase [Candidatus Thermoplasmatota archaeon]|nr:NADH:flavin oxidoreductase [Candidatus Thermoplasmatota archaeon]